MTKEDYMKLSKERLAELLVERDMLPIQIPVMPVQQGGLYCDGSNCVNPFHDCINCPRQFSSVGTVCKPNSCE
jgi:hypothetical protein